MGSPGVGRNLQPSVDSATPPDARVRRCENHRSAAVFRKPQKWTPRRGISRWCACTYWAGNRSPSVHGLGPTPRRSRGVVLGNCCTGALVSGPPPRSWEPITWGARSRTRGARFTSVTGNRSPSVHGPPAPRSRGEGRWLFRSGGEDGAGEEWPVSLPAKSGVTVKRRYTPKKPYETTVSGVTLPMKDLRNATG